MWKEHVYPMKERKTSYNKKGKRTSYNSIDVITTCDEINKTKESTEIYTINGSSIFFGSYPYGSNGEIKPIEWYIVAKSENKVLLFSKYSLECGAYHSKKEKISWKGCSLRRYLNDDFFQKAFSEQEQSVIMSVSVPEDEIGIENLDPYAISKDRVFILSEEEIKLCEISYENLFQAPTPYALKRRPFYTGRNEYWWTRSCFGLRKNVINYETLKGTTMDCTSSQIYIRPALWITLDDSKPTQFDKDLLQKDVIWKRFSIPFPEISIGKEIMLGCYPQKIRSEEIDISDPIERRELGIEEGDIFSYDSEVSAPIEWRILDVTEDSILLISKYALMNEILRPADSVQWEFSEIRSYLNNSFISEAFTQAQQAAIILKTVPADMNPKYNQFPGENTKDKLFLLSVKEAKKYFKTDEDRKGYASEYAISTQKVFSQVGPCWWWLRTPGANSSDVTNVSTYGTINTSGYSYHYSLGLIRPAMWINLTLIDKEMAPTVGGALFFGAFPQGKSGEVLPIEWIILAIDNNLALVISKFGLKFGTASTNTQLSNKQELLVWETSTLRNKLNRDFIRDSFSYAQQKNILGGPYKIFLLSCKDVEKYLPNESDRVGFPTDILAKHYINSEKPFLCRDSADDTLDKKASGWVRPAMWVKKNILDEGDVFSSPNEKQYLWDLEEA